MIISSVKLTNLNKWINQGRHGLSAARMTNKSSPKFQAVHELPVVHRQQGVLLLTAGDCISEVDGQLPDVDKGVVVCKTVVEA